MKIENCKVLASVFSVLLLSGCATHSTRTDALPVVLHPPAGQTLAYTLKATGVQIYECQDRKDDPTKFEWTFKSPEGDLFDQAGRKAGTHFKGPTWKSNDGSSVVGEKPSSHVQDTSAIPWLLLGVKLNEGTGVFSKVTSIQRVDTTGGKAPAAGCDGMSSGKEIRVPYTATYHFFVTKP